MKALRNDVVNKKKAWVLRGVVIPACATVFVAGCYIVWYYDSTSQRAERDRRREMARRSHFGGPEIDPSVLRGPSEEDARVPWLIKVINGWHSTWARGGL